MTDTDYKTKYENLCMKLMHEFTPGGSEFWMDPERCIEFAKIQRDGAYEDMKHTRILLNRSRLLHWLWNRVDKRERKRRHNAST